MNELNPLNASPLSIDEFIDLIRGGDEDSTVEIVTEIFMQGNCINLALILKHAYPHDDLVTTDNNLNIALQLNGRIYDIRGDITNIVKTNGVTFKPISAYAARGHFVVNNYAFDCRGPVG